MVSSPSAGFCTSMCPPDEETSFNNKPVNDSEVEERISERLVQGCMLLESACPACVTPLVKQTDDGPSDDNSLMMGLSRPGSKSDHDLTPIEGVPFCVACPCHVITTPEEAEKVEENLDNINEKVLVTYEMEEPQYSNTRRSLVDDMSDILSESQKRRAKGSGGNASPISSKLRAHIRKSQSSVKSRKKAVDKNGFQRVSDTSTTVEDVDKHYSKNNEQLVNEPVQRDEKREEQYDRKEKQEAEGAERRDEMVEAFVENKIDEINVQKYSSVDAEDLTAADVLTLVDSEDEMITFEEKKAIAARALGVKIMKGYSLLEKQCALCKMPLTEHKGTVECVVCPLLKKRKEKLKRERDHKERERIRLALEAQLQQHRQNKNRGGTKSETKDNSGRMGSPTAKNDPNLQKYRSSPTHHTTTDDPISFERAKEALISSDVNVAKKARSASPTKPRNLNLKQDEEGESKNKQCFENAIPSIEDYRKEDASGVDMTGTTDAADDESCAFVKLKNGTAAENTEEATDECAFVELEDETSGANPKPTSDNAPVPGEEGVEVGLDTLQSKVSEELSPKSYLQQAKSNLSGQGLEVRLESLDSKVFEKHVGSNNFHDRHRPKRPIMSIKKVTPQPCSAPASVMGLSRYSQPAEAALSLRSKKMQPGTIEEEEGEDKETQPGTIEEEKGKDTDNLFNKAIAMLTGKMVLSPRKEIPSPKANIQSPRKEKDTLEKNKSEESVDESKVSSMHSDSTISSKSHMFRKKRHASKSDKASPVEPIAEEGEDTSNNRHWELLRSESTALVARRCIIGWKVLPEKCKGKECRDIQLIGFGNVKECVICGGSGTGKDGVYELLSKDKLLSATKSPASPGSSILKSVVDSVQGLVQGIENMANDGDSEDQHSVEISFEDSASSDSTFFDLGLGEISVVKSLASALSFNQKPLVMSVIARPQLNFPVTKNVLQVHKNFENNRPLVGKRIALKLSQGWTLLNMTCPRCVMPLMSNQSGQNEICLSCGYNGNASLALQTVTTAPTDLTSDKSKDSPSEDEISAGTGFRSMKSRQSAIRASPFSVSEESTIADWILQSTMHNRNPSPRGDPPALRRSPRANQIEAEDSRFVSGFDPVDPSPRFTVQPRSLAPDEQHTAEEPFIIVLDDSSELGTNEDNLMKRKIDSVKDQSQVFAIAVPKGFNVGEGRAVTNVINAAKLSESRSQGKKDIAPLSPTVLSTTDYRLPSPGMTEASMPHMSPENSQSRPSPSSQFSPTHSTRTQRWKNSQDKLQKPRRNHGFDKPPPYRSKRVSRDPVASKDGLVSCDNSVASGTSGRRRVTPEIPAGRPRGIVRSRSTPRTTRRQSSKDLQIYHKPGKFHFSMGNRSVASAASSTSSANMPLRLPTSCKEQRSLTLSITSVSEVPGCEDYVSPLAAMENESTFGESGTGSVTSEAIDDLLARIEETQNELKAAELEEEGANKDRRMKELMGRLSEAAEAIKRMDK